MRRGRRAAEAEDAGIDVTPMLDVVFILLIFFLVTASFVKETGIDVVTPEATTATPKERATLLIAIDADGQVWIDRRRVDVRAVRANVERLLAENPKGGVVIQADGASRNEVFVRVLDQAKQAGAENVAIAATPEEPR